MHAQELQLEYIVLMNFLLCCLAQTFYPSEYKVPYNVLMTLPSMTIDSKYILYICVCTIASFYNVKRARKIRAEHIAAE